MVYLLVVILGVSAVAEIGPQIGPDKKIIKVGQDMPDAAYVREHIREMERLPFDGVVIDPTAEIDGEKERLWLRWWAPEAVSEEMVEATVQDLKATPFTRFTDNFLWVSSQSQHKPAPGWWDDEAFETITANMALAARVARDSGLKGLLLDVEQYGGMAWSPYMMRFSFPDAHAQETNMFSRQLIDRIHTWDEFAAGARQRGREIMSAMCAVYPDVTLLVIPGLHQVAKEDIGRDTSLEGLASSRCGLLAPFGDGLLEGASPQATIIDGFEGSYPYTLNKRFVQARARVERAVDVSAVPELYKERVNAGFGLMLDHNHALRGWHTDPESFGRNQFTPVDFSNALYFAMLNSDRYVWIWNELRGAVFWQPGRHPDVTPNVPDEYLAAMAQARNPRDLNTERDNREAERMPIPESATELPGYSDEATFGPLSDHYEIAADLPRQWLFFADDEMLGFHLGYALPETDVSNWDTIEIGDYFQRQGKRFRGIAWYRCAFHVPKHLEGKKVVLLFGGVSANHVWVNGRWCDYAVKNGVRIPDFTSQAKFGQDNVVVVPIFTNGAPAGVYKSVKLATLRSPTSD